MAVRKQAKKGQKSESPGDEPLSKDSERILSALSYPLLIVIPLVLLALSKKENKIGKFNGYQGLFFGVAWIVIYGIISVFGEFPFIGPLFTLMASLIGIGFFVLSIFYAVRVYQGKIVKVPILYGLVPKEDRL